MRQGVPGFEDIVKAWALKISKNIELYEVLYYYRSEIQRLNLLCNHSYLLLSHSESSSKF